MVKSCIIELNLAADAVCEYLDNRENPIPSEEFKTRMDRFWLANEEAKAQEQIRETYVPTAEEGEGKVQV